ncbi:MAG: hypothetical protein LUF26_01725 [Firmicutes bacterium]|nr:hypothetical protein [Bacillota bacterium]
MKQFNLQEIKNKKITLPKIKIKPAEITVVIAVITLAALIIVPSLVQCVTNRDKAKCESHMNNMVSILSTVLAEETESGSTYWHDLIANGNYQKLISSLNDRTGEGDKFSPSDYYIQTGEEKLMLYSKKHRDISAKEIKFSLMQDVSVEIGETRSIGEKIAYLMVSGPDTYYQNQSLDGDHPSKMIFRGTEVDKVITNLKVTAVYVGGASAELGSSEYTIIADELDMSEAGQTRLFVKVNSNSLWDGSAYASFIIDVIGSEEMGPLVVDGGINGKFELASWDWNDFVEEASQEDGGKDFGASIVRYNGDYYYYPDGMRITNSNKNINPLDFALDRDDNSESAYYIKFDPSSVIMNDDDEKEIHNGSVKVENDLIYIWQDVPSKESDAGWIRVYCDLKKY